MTPPPPTSTLFPYTTLFRSGIASTGNSRTAPLSSRPTGALYFASTGRDGARLRTRSEEHTSELQSRLHLVCRLLLEKKNKDIPNRDRAPSADSVANADPTAA